MRVLISLSAVPSDVRLPSHKYTGALWLWAVLQRTELSACSRTIFVDDDLRLWADDWCREDYNSTMQQHRDRRVADHVSASETYKWIHIITAIAHDSTRKRSAQHSKHIHGIMIESMIAKSMNGLSWHRFLTSTSQTKWKFQRKFLYGWDSFYWSTCEFRRTLLILFCDRPPKDSTFLGLRSTCHYLHADDLEIWQTHQSCFKDNNDLNRRVGQLNSIKTTMNQLIICVDKSFSHGIWQYCAIAVFHKNSVCGIFVHTSPCKNTVSPTVPSRMIGLQSWLSTS